MMKKKSSPQRKTPEKNGLIGLFAHTFGDDQIEKQGRIIGLDGDMVLVWFCCWINGSPTVVEGIPKSLIYSRDCVLCATNEDMCHAYETKYRYGGRPSR